MNLFSYPGKLSGSSNKATLIPLFVFAHSLAFMTGRYFLRCWNDIYELGPFYVIIWSFLVIVQGPLSQRSFFKLSSDNSVYFSAYSTRAQRDNKCLQHFYDSIYESPKADFMRFFGIFRLSLFPVSGKWLFLSSRRSPNSRFRLSKIRFIFVASGFLQYCNNLAASWFCEEMLQLGIFK